MTNSKAKLESVCLVPTALIHIKSDKKVKNKGLESCDSKCEEAGRPSGYLQEIYRGVGISVPTP